MAWLAPEPLEVDDKITRASEKLRAMMVRSENSTRRAEVLEALHNNHEGIQSLALQVLGAWGSTDSIGTLRTFLTQAWEREAGWSIRGVAVKSLAPHIRPADAEWVLELYFSRPALVEKHELLPLVVRLPVEVARETLVRRLRDSEAVNRHAALKAIGNMAFPDRHKLLRPFLDDPDKLVRGAARTLLG